MHLTAQNDYSLGLLPLTDALFDEHVSFTKLCVGVRLPESTLQSYGMRARVTTNYLKVLEQVAELRLAPGTPFVYNTVNWAGPPGGYCGLQPTDPLPSQLLATMLSRWYAHCKDLPLTPRAVTAAAYMLLTSDLPTAITYVFDCLRWGLIGLEAGSGVLISLAQAAGKSSRPEEMVGLLVPGVSLDSPTAAWADANVGPTVFESLRPTVDLAPIIEVVIEQCLVEVAGLRASQSLDEWCLRQAQVLAVLRPALRVLDVSRAPLPLSVKTIESQLEEIQADAGSFLLSLRDRPLCGADLVALHEQMVMITSHSEGMGRRLREQRVVRPTALADGSQPVGGAWHTVSPQLITPLLELYRPEDRADRDQIRPCHSGSPVASGSSGHDFEGEVDTFIAAIEAGNHALVEDLASRALLELPWSTTLWWELSIARDEAGKHREALDAILPALTLTPDLPALWGSFATILGRCGQDTEARLASAVAAAQKESAAADMAEGGLTSQDDRQSLGDSNT